MANVFLIAGINDAELMVLDEYIIHPMHSVFAAWHGRGCRFIDRRCFDREKCSESSIPNFVSGTWCGLSVTRRRFK
jgi:hypothetical protein